METGNRPLIRISNLKQWFPLKKKGSFVKANDGITLDICEGETFGLVGESGCGKSTLGRTLLQFYRLTDGRIMYYGRSLWEMAPVYIRKMLNRLPARRKEYARLNAKREEFQAAYDRLDEKARYAQKEKLDKTVKDADNAFFDIASLVGGLMLMDDLRPIRTLYLRLYDQHRARRKVSLRMQRAGSERDDARYRAEKLGEVGKNVSATQRRLNNAEKRIRAAQTELERLDREIAETQAKLGALRAVYTDNPEFARVDAFREDGINLAKLSNDEMRTLRCDLQLIFQDPYSSLNPRMTCGQIIGEGMLAHGMFRKNDARMQETVLKVMYECGLAPYFLHRFPHQFSGGQRQRIGIARSLAVNPKFIVCDEAVSALDVSIQSQIINLLQDLKEKQNLTYLFITHDLSVVKYISDRIGVMYLGVLVEMAKSQEIFDHPRHPYTEALLAAIPTTDVGDNKKPLQVLEGDIPSPVNPPKGCKLHTRCKYCTEICTQVVPDWEEVSADHYVACHHKRP